MEQIIIIIIIKTILLVVSNVTKEIMWMMLSKSKLQTFQEILVMWDHLFQQLWGNAAKKMLQNFLACSVHNFLLQRMKESGRTDLKEMGKKIWQDP